MLLRPISPAPWPGGSSHLCAKCGEMAAGIPVGGLCPSCTRLVTRQAGRIGRWAAMGTTLPLALYVALRFPPDPTARLVGAGAVLLWYGLTFIIAKRVALEWLK